jgi:UDP-2-acetamido-3-amino-2,3-dideoxy-glucuronate N-acetyltransferase
MTGNNTAAPYQAHETAIIDPGAVIGAGTRIWHWAHICAMARIGANCSLGQNVYVGDARIGNNVKIQNNVSVYDAVELEDDVFCGPSMVFTNVMNPRASIPRKHEFRRTLVKRGATIGAGAVIVCGHSIGRYAMVGAGAVVTRDVADFTLVAGNPARRMGWVCRCGIRLKLANGHAECEVCKCRYVLDAGWVREAK